MASSAARDAWRRTEDEIGRHDPPVRGLATDVASAFMTDMAGSRVLVTGGRGFIGQAVIDRLRSAGATVAATSFDAQGVARSGDDPGVEWIRADVRSFDEMQAAVRSARPDILIHLAARVAGDRRIERVLPMLEADLLGAVYTLIAATEAGVGRVVFAGSLLQEPLREIDEPVPPSPYGAAKWAAAGYARMFHALYDTPVVVVRPSLVYGPRQLDLTKFVPHVTTTLLRGETANLTSGAWRVDWLYVEDLADALVAAGTSPGIDGATIDLGSGEIASVREVALRIAEIVGPPGELAFGEVPDRQLDPVKAVDVTEAQRAIGWTAQVPLEDGLRATVDWFRGWVAESGPS